MYKNIHLSINKYIFDYATIPNLRNYQAMVYQY
jgi:hypothetical protein